MANDVVVHPNQYHYADEAVSKKSFMQKYLPELTKIYERQSVKPRGPKKVVVFDLDETIGSFGDLYALWQSLPKTVRPNSDYVRFKGLLDLYPEFFRPGIYPVIEYIYRKIERGISHPIHVYTNNQCDAPYWVSMILRYIEEHVTRASTHRNGCGRLFADPICAFKIGGRRVNLKRTTPRKTPADFVRCSVIPRGAEICFIDDQTHEQMKTKKIYYIQPPPYQHPLRRETIMDRFERSALFANYFSYRNNAATMKTGFEGCLSPSGQVFAEGCLSPSGQVFAEGCLDPSGQVFAEGCLSPSGQVFAEGCLSPSGQVFDGGSSAADERIGRKIMFYVREFFLSELPATSRTRKHRDCRLTLARTKRCYST